MYVYIHTHIVHVLIPYSPHSTLSDSIMNNPLGHVTPRNGGGSLLLGFSKTGLLECSCIDYINPDY